MKSKKVLGIVFLILILALYGCGGSDEGAKVKVDTEEGKVEVNTSEGKVEVNTSEGKVEVNTEENNEDSNDEEENNVEVNTEGAEVEVSEGGKDLDIEDYKEFGKYKVQSIVFESEDEDGYQINYITSATKEEITEHYKEFLKDGKDFMFVDQMGMAIIEVIPKEDSSISMSISEINGEVNVTYAYYAGE